MTDVVSVDFTDEEVLKTGVHSEQLLYWKQLLLQFQDKCASFIDNNWTCPTNDELLVMQVIYNNVFVNKTPNRPDNVYQVPLSLFYGGSLCLSHGPVEFMRLSSTLLESNHIGVHFPIVNLEFIPVEMDPILYYAMVWYQNYVQHCFIHNIPGFFRLYEFQTMIVNKNGSSALSLNQEMILLTPREMTVDNILHYKQQHENFMIQLRLVKLSYIYCKYCFPNLYGVLVHSMEKKYECKIRNIPPGMNQVFCVYSRDIMTNESAFQLYIQVLKTHMEHHIRLWCLESPTTIYRKLIRRISVDISKRMNKLNMSLLLNENQFHLHWLSSFEENIVKLGLPIQSLHEQQQQKHRLPIVQYPFIIPEEEDEEEGKEENGKEQ